MTIYCVLMWCFYFRYRSANFYFSVSCLSFRFVIFQTQSWCCCCCWCHIMRNRVKVMVGLEADRDKLNVFKCRWFRDVSPFPAELDSVCGALFDVFFPRISWCCCLLLSKPAKLFWLWTANRWGKLLLRQREIFRCRNLNFKLPVVGVWMCFSLSVVAAILSP